MAKDLYHENVKIALEEEGWTITDDPYYVSALDSSTYEIDLGAEKLLIAEKGLEKIAIEIKSFANPSIAHDFHKALGQYMSYQSFMEEDGTDIGRKLYLAIPQRAYEAFFMKASTQLLLSKFHVHLIVFNEVTNKIISWLEN